MIAYQTPHLFLALKYRHLALRMMCVTAIPMKQRRFRAVMEKMDDTSKVHNIM